MAWESRTILPSTINGLVSNTSDQLVVLASNAERATIGFIVEPGSKISVTARFLALLLSKVLRLLGSKEGAFTMASTSPEITSINTALPLSASFSSTTFFKDW